MAGAESVLFCFLLYSVHHQLNSFLFHTVGLSPGRYLWETKGKEARCFYRCFSGLAHTAGEGEAIPAASFWFFFHFVISECEFGVLVMSRDFVATGRSQSKGDVTACDSTTQPSLRALRGSQRLA